MRISGCLYFVFLFYSRSSCILGLHEKTDCSQSSCDIRDQVVSYNLKSVNNSEKC